jgi:hypothetical protein
MKATMDIPDTLYRKVKAKSALAGQPVREVAIRLFSAWVDEPAVREAPASEAPQSLPPWFGVASAYAHKVKRHDLASVRASIAKARAQA